MTETIDSANAAASSLFLGQNGEWWDFWLIVSVIVAASAAIAIGITTAGSIVSHKREATSAEVALELFKLQTERKISEANARAAEAKLELEKFKAPRALSPEQQAVVSAKVKPFAGQEYAFAISPTADALPLMEQIDKALKDAGWVRVEPLGPLVVGGAAVAYFKELGVRVQVSKSRNADLGPTATFLAETLTGAGIVAASAMSPDVDVRPTAIQIVIGIKPQ
jgi:hypothetical protein